MTQRIKKVNNTFKYVDKVAAMYMGEQVDLKQRTANKKTKPWWKRRIEGDIKRLGKDVKIFIGTAYKK